MKTQTNDKKKGFVYKATIKYFPLRTIISIHFTAVNNHVKVNAITNVATTTTARIKYVFNVLSTEITILFPFLTVFFFILLLFQLLFAFGCQKVFENIIENVCGAGILHVNTERLCFLYSLFGFFFFLFFKPTYNGKHYWRLFSKPKRNVNMCPKRNKTKNR